MRKILLLSLCLFSFAIQANNLKITNVSLSNQDKDAKTYDLTFDVSWDNSWRLEGAPGNHDAAWLFVKYRWDKGPWLHGRLLAEGSLAPAGAELDVTTDSVGAFIYRNVSGTGSVSYTGLALKWFYGDSTTSLKDGYFYSEYNELYYNNRYVGWFTEESLPDSIFSSYNMPDNALNLELKVLGVEMVYIPEGSFYLGDGVQGWKNGNSADPYYVTHDGVHSMGTAEGQLGTYGQVLSGSIPESFPMGYDPFYVMKYEVTAGQYLEFMNSLSRQGQAGLESLEQNIEPGISSLSNRFVLWYDYEQNSNRAIIKAPASFDPEAPIQFFLDWNRNDVPNETGDGANFISGRFSDERFLRWCGLRYITQPEFEKAARGPLYPQPNEYAFGLAYSEFRVAGGSSDGSGSDQLSQPRGITIDASGNLYIADFGNHRIQKWAPGASAGETVAGGNAAGDAANQLNYPSGVAVDGAGNVYVADQYNHRVQKWAPGATEGETVAGGNGRGAATNQLDNPRDIFIDPDGNVYVSDFYNHRVQKFSPGASEGETVAGGNGYGSAANQLKYPRGIFIDATGNVYVVDGENYRVQKWSSVASEGETVAGGNGYGSAANQLAYPQDVYVDANGVVYVADENGILQWQAGAEEGVTLVAKELPSGEGLYSPSSIVAGPSGNLYISTGWPHKVYKIPTAANFVSSFKLSVSGTIGEGTETLSPDILRPSALSRWHFRKQLSDTYDIPLRAGLFADGANTRGKSGASYYGVNGLSGGVREGWYSVDTDGTNEYDWEKLQGDGKAERFISSRPTLRGQERLNNKGGEISAPYNNYNGGKPRGARSAN